MIFSRNQLFSENQDLAKTAATIVSTNVIDTGKPGRVFGAAADIQRNVGPGSPIYFVAQVVEDFAAANSAATVTIRVETADNEAFTTNKKVIASSRAYSLTELKAGKNFGVDTLPNDCQRFLRMSYILSHTTTSGEITAGITTARQTNN